MAPSQHSTVGPANGPGEQAAAGKLPQKIGRFEILALLGQGAFGRVYKAHDPQLDRAVALKVPLRGAGWSEQERARFVREAQAAASLHHPNICPVYEVGKEGEQDYIVMACVPGKSLAEHLKERKDPLPAKQAALIIRKLALALEMTHSKGIIHRDLKPANIMFDSERKDVVIMDFGLARRNATPAGTNQDQDTQNAIQQTQDGVVIGTPAYMAPEQASGDIKSVGPASDVYSLGVMLYVMLAGRPPFTGSVTEVLGKVLHVEPEKPSQLRKGVDPALEAICLKAMAKKAGERFSSMRELADALGNYFKGRKPAVIPTDSSEGKVETREGVVPSEKAAFAEFMSAMFAERKAEAAVRRVETVAVVEAAVRKARIPWWQWLVGAGLLGIFIVASVLFLVPVGTTTVIIQIPLPEGIDLSDTSLAFFLDGKPITADEIDQPMPLTLGDHELLIQRGEQIIKRIVFSVRGGKYPAIENVKVTTGDTEMTNSIGMKLALIPAGKFRMGSPENEPGRDANEGPRHDVTITQPFYMGRHEVTVGQFRDFVKETGHQTEAERGGAGALRPGGEGLNPNLTWNTPDWDQTDDYPVTCISFNDADAFCRWLTAKEERLYRLPTEAEWEYACRAGSQSAFFFGESIDELGRFAWHAGNSGGRPHPVGQLAPNAWGLYDILGNIIEMCSDDFAPDFYSRSPSEDPAGPQPRTRANRIGRGAAWSNAPDSWFRSAFRWPVHPDSSHRSTTLGFRVVCETRPMALDRRAAEWVLSAGGVTDIVVQGRQQRVQNLAELPQAGFTISAIDIDYKPINESDLEYLRGLNRLGYLAVRGTPLGDSVLAHARELRDLWEIAVEGARVTDAGLEHLKGMSALRIVRLNGTLITDVGLEHLRGLDLRIIGLDGTGISDAGLNHLSGMANLEDLWAHNTRITDAGLEHLKGMTKLRHLGLAGTQVSDAGLVHLKAISALKDLHLDSTKVSDAGLELLKDLDLNSLGLRATQITGDGLIHLKGMKRLRMLWIGGNQITDSGLQHIRDLHELSELDLSATNVTDAGLVHLKGFPKLIGLNLSRTKVTESGAAELHAALPNCNITR